MVHSSLADEAKYLVKDTPAPFTGFLISPEKAEKIRIMDIDLRLATRTNEILTTENTLLKDHNTYLAKELVDTRDNSMWGKIGYFILGAVLTTGIAFGVSKATK